MTYKIAPSMMCCDILHLGEQLAAFKSSGVELLHVDVMDGSFVPNFALGTDFVRQLRRASDIPLDIHLMCENPDRHLDGFGIREGDMVSIHYETTRHVERVLQSVRARGAKAYLALNPGSPVELATVRNKKSATLFGRCISQDSVKRAVAVVVTFVTICAVSTVLLLATSDASALDAVYETVSATATVGLSRNLTATLNTFGKLIIIVTMYFGRVGPISLAVALGSKNESQNIISEPTEDISIG